MKAKSIALLLLSFVMFTPLSHAATDDTGNDQNPLRKLSRGVANLICGVVEVPNQVTQTISKSGGAAGTTYGLGKGLLRWLGREVVGVYEIITFPIPFPKDYKPIMKPEFPAEDYEP